MINRKSSFIVTVITGLALVGIAWYCAQEFYFSQVNSDLKSKKEKYEELKFKNDDDEQMKQNADQLERSLAEAEKSFSSLKPLIPGEAELPQILNWVGQQASLRGLKFDYFSQGTQMKQAGALIEVPVSVEVLGYYDAVERFVEDFSRFERVLNVRSVNMLKDTTDTSGYQKVKAIINFSAFVSKQERNMRAAS